MARCFYFIFFALTVTSAFGQLTLSGTVRNAATMKPLVGANVFLDTGKGQVADSVGRFQFKDVPPGQRTIRVSYVGYVTKSDTLQLQSDQVVIILMTENDSELEPLVIHATRAGTTTPTTYINVSQETLKQQNFGQDMPLLLNWTPSVVTTSDAGTGIGYTGIRIRGSDATRVNVTINGIPYNDSESQTTYWVDIPDIASSSQSVQIQRGVGTSTNGPGAFGASVNLETTNANNPGRYAEAVVGGGSFGTLRYNMRAGFPFLSRKLFLEAKVSAIKSNGYVERASSNLLSSYVSMRYKSGTTSIQGIFIGGSEETYQSWYGVDEATLQSNRRMNYAGAIYDATGNITSYYGNQVDNYRQNHLQLHFTKAFSEKWEAKVALHGTAGWGYYEEYHQNRTFSSIGLPDFGADTASNMVLRKWLDNKFYGMTYSVQYGGIKSTLVIGGAIHRYSPAKHFGEVIWAEIAGSVPQDFKYYAGESSKSDGNIYVKWSYKLTDKLNSFVDLQYRGVDYKTAGTQDDLSSYSIEDHFDFFNPKVGLSYEFKPHSVLYASYAIANREPNRTDYLSGSTKPRSERLHNLEFGLRHKTEKYSLDANYFLMQYTDQLVQTGAIDGAGYPIHANVGNSYRTGVEVSGSIPISGRLTWGANATWSMNQNKDFIVFEGSVPVAKNTKIILSPGIIAGSQLTWKPLLNVEAAWLSKYVSSQYLDNTESAALHLSDYWINDLRLVYEMPLHGRIMSISWSVLANNVMDVMYSSNGYSYNGAPYYFPQAGRNFMAMMTVKF